MSIEKQATELLISNGELVADTLRHLANNEIDSDYFAIMSTSENGTEIEHELAITDYVLQAAGTVDELVKALEAAASRIAELEAREVSLPPNELVTDTWTAPGDGWEVFDAQKVINSIRSAGVKIAAGISVKGE